MAATREICGGQGSARGRFAQGFVQGFLGCDSITVASCLSWLDQVLPGVVLFMAASRSILGILDRMQYEALRVVSSCMRSIPVAILLSQANEPPLVLCGFLLCCGFILRHAAWRDSPLIPRLRLLLEKARWKGCRLNPEKCGLLAAYEGARGVSEFCFRSTRPRYFDCARGEIAGPVLRDFETGGEVKGSVEPSAVFDQLVHVRYPDSVFLFSDEARDPSNERVGAGFCVPASGYRFGVRLSYFTSALSAELYAAFCALKHVYRLEAQSAVIFTDSLFSLYHLRDRLSFFLCLPSHTRSCTWLHSFGIVRARLDLPGCRSMLA